MKERQQQIKAGFLPLRSFQLIGMFMIWCITPATAQTVTKENFVCIYKNNIALFVELERQAVKPNKLKVEQQLSGSPAKTAETIFKATQGIDKAKLVSTVKALRDKYLESIPEERKNLTAIQLDTKLTELGVLRAVQIKEPPK